MNYRHAFHAGNHTEVFKHSALVHLLDRLLAKPKPFMVLDTHAGLGVYDLNSPEAVRTGEAAAGIGAVFDRLRGKAASYASLVRPYLSEGRYPGSPAIVADRLRLDDRLVACEFHPEDVTILRRNFARTGTVAVHHRDGYEAMTALVPPPERRGLVFVDPPFESRDEPDRLGSRLAAAIRKWPTGIYVGWYPVKDPTTRPRILAQLERDWVPSCLWAEFYRFPPDGLRLAGSGLVVVNAPWKFDETLRSLGTDLIEAFGDEGGAIAVEWAKAPD